MIAGQHTCTEQNRLERIESKIDRLIDDVAVIKPVVPLVQRHDTDIRELQISQKVNEKLATRTQVFIGISISILSVLIAAIPYIIKILSKG